MNLLAENPTAQGGLAVAIVWGLKEIGSFILKYRKQNHELFYKPEEAWKNTVMKQFGDIQASIAGLTESLKCLNLRMTRFETTMVHQSNGKGE